MTDRASIERRRSTRLSEMVAYARKLSPYYRQLYDGLPEHIEDQTILPATSKAKLMARFDEWSTDRDVTRDKVAAFLADPGLVGKRFLGKYRVSTTSGVTGTRLTFVTDEGAEAVIEQVTRQMISSWFSWLDGISLMIQTSLHRARSATIIATGGHTSASSRLTMKAGEKRDETRRVLSVQSPLPELVSQLNEFRPTFLQGYASTIALLADEQSAGRLHIRPKFVMPMSEGLPDRRYTDIATAFHAKIGIAYGGTECGAPVAWSCKERWLHLNSDWAIVEPVDANFQPVGPGVQSHTVLISNLANKVLPILRYDMGDSILLRPDACPCGNPMPAIHVLGRVADVLKFKSQNGDDVRITSLQLSTIVYRSPGVQLFQLVQTSPSAVRVRLLVAADADANGVWLKVESQLGALFHSNGLESVAVERATEPPEQAIGGKYREVIPLGQ